MAKNYWLVKQEPVAYAWQTFQQEGGTAWTGVRNFQARNFLRTMKPGDAVFYYHSGEEKQIVGVAKVSKAAYPDPTAEEGDWSAVDLVPVAPLKKTVPLAIIKADAVLQTMPLVRQSRLSVSPVSEEQARQIQALAQA